MIKIIVAINKNNIIGVDGKLPWHVKDDLNHFKETTDDSVCIMGRKTWDSIPDNFKPLSNRVNIILTKDPQAFKIKNNLNINHNFQTVSNSVIGVFQDLDLALKNISIVYSEDIYIIGGAEVYKQALDNDLVDEIIVSKILDNNISEGIKFPIDLNKNWFGKLKEVRQGFEVWVYKKMETEMEGQIGEDIKNAEVIPLKVDHKLKIGSPLFEDKFLSEMKSSKTIWRSSSAIAKAIDIDSEILENHMLTRDDLAKKKNKENNGYFYALKERLENKTLQPKDKEKFVLAELNSALLILEHVVKHNSCLIHNRSEPAFVEMVKCKSALESTILLLSASLGIDADQL